MVKTKGDKMTNMYKTRKQRVNTSYVSIEKILNFLDKLELNQPEDLKTDNWRNWKYIRNSIRNKYEL